MKILLLIALLLMNANANEFNKQSRLTEVKKQDYISELVGTNQIKWFFWMTKSGRVFIADTRKGEDADSVTLWEHSLRDFTWTPISGGNVEKIFNNITISSDGRSITLGISSATSFVSGKTIVIDPSDNSTMIFGKDGNYNESGADYSCSGKWVHLSKNTVVATCESSGTTLTPNSSSFTLVFTSETITNGMNVSIYEKGIDNSVARTTTVISIN